MVLLLVSASLSFLDNPPNSQAAKRDKELAQAGAKVVAPGHRTLTQALETAMRTVKDATPVEVKAEVHGDERVFGAYLLKDDVLHEVEVDVVTSKVLKNREKPLSAEQLSQFKSLAGRNKLSFARAVERAVERCKKGNAIRVRLEEKGDGKERMAQVGVYLLDGDRLVEVELNGEQGEVLAVKEKTIR